MPGNPIVIYDGPSVIRQQGQMTGGGDSVGGIAVSGTPSAGQVLTATSATAANWQAGGGGGGSVNSVTATDGSIVVAGTASDPTVATGTLDAIAAAHAPAANWSNNSKKITSLANGSAAQDAAAFGQIPTALPPNGAAGGDLTGTYPNPTLANAGGGAAGPTGSTSVVPVVTVDAKGRVTALTSASPTVATLAAPAGALAMNAQKITGLGLASAGTDAASLANTLDQFGAPAANVAFNAKKITGLANGSAATDAAAFGQIPTALPPNGTASGDLGGSYPSPTVRVWRNPGIPTGGLFESVPRSFGNWTNTSTSLVSQRLALQIIALPTGLTVTSISVMSATTALVGGNHQIFGLFDDAAGSSSATPYALLRGTSDDTSTAWGANTVKTLNLTSSYLTTRAGFFYIGILVDAGTVPTLMGITPDANLSALAPVQLGSSNTGITALPNPANAPTATSKLYYVYVS